MYSSVVDWASYPNKNNNCCSIKKNSSFIIQLSDEDIDSINQEQLVELSNVLPKEVPQMESIIAKTRNGKSFTFK